MVDFRWGRLSASSADCIFAANWLTQRPFPSAPDGLPGALIITAGGGLLPPETPINREQLCLISSAPVEASEPRYRIPLERDARLVAEHLSGDCEVVLLGSVATPKYVEPLLAIFGDRLVFPKEFAGRGDMSRGGADASLRA